VQVRAPFANYMPDFVVVNRGVWEAGAGGLRALGYWGPTWTFDEDNAVVDTLANP